MNPESSESHLESRDRPQQNVLVLGATGSIGTATVDVLRNLNQVDPTRGWCLWGASAHSQVDKLLEIQAEAERWQSQSSPCRLLFSDQDVAKSRVESERLPQTQGNHAGAIGVGPESLVQAAQSPEVDTVVAAIVGFAGLASVLSAIRAGRQVCLANKARLECGPS